MKRRFRVGGFEVGRSVVGLLDGLLDGLSGNLILWSAACKRGGFWVCWVCF